MFKPIGGSPPLPIADEHVRRVVRKYQLRQEEIRRLTQDMNIQSLADLLLIQNDLSYIFHDSNAEDVEVGPPKAKNNVRQRRMEAILYELERGMSPFLLDSHVLSQILMERRCKERKNGQPLVIPTIFHMAAGVIIIHLVSFCLSFLACWDQNKLAKAVKIVVVTKCGFHFLWRER